MELHYIHKNERSNIFQVVLFVMSLICPTNKLFYFRKPFVFGRIFYRLKSFDMAYT